MAKKNADAETRFEDDLEQLEDTIAQLESGRLDLDGALARFEEGVGLARKLRARLDAAEGRIEQLLANGETRRIDAPDAE